MVSGNMLFPFSIGGAAMQPEPFHPAQGTCFLSASALALGCPLILFFSLGDSALFESDEGRNAEPPREIFLLNDWVMPRSTPKPGNSCESELTA